MRNIVLVAAAAATLLFRASGASVGSERVIRGPTSTRQAFTHQSGAGLGLSSAEARGSFGFVGLSFSILPFLPPDQNITLALTHSELSVGTWDVPPEQDLYPVINNRQFADGL